MTYNNMCLRVIRAFCCVCFFTGIVAVPVSKIFAADKQSRDSTYSNESLLYNLLIKMMSTGSLRYWINQYILRPSGADSSGLNSGTTTVSFTTTPHLTFERDHGQTAKTTTPQSGGAPNSTPKSTKIPVVILTGPEAEKIVDPVTTPNSLTIIRDFPQSNAQTTPSSSKRRRRSAFVVPLVNLKSKDDYNKPADSPPVGSLTGDDEEASLVIVRDKDHSNSPKSATDSSNQQVDRDQNQSNPPYNTGNGNESTQPLFRIYKCGNFFCIEFASN